MWDFKCTRCGRWQAVVGDPPPNVIVCDCGKTWRTRNGQPALEVRDDGTEVPAPEPPEVYRRPSVRWELVVVALAMLIGLALLGFKAFENALGRGLSGHGFTVPNVPSLEVYFDDLRNALRGGDK